jgi:hypothetical protein
MIAPFAAVRRVALCVLALVLLGAAANALAQDPRAAEAQKAARAWLELVDKLDANASFAAAGARFREPITAAEWADAITKGRAPLGAVEQRAVAETAFDKAKGDNGAEFEVALVRYRTSFAKRVDISETITLEHDPTGAWRVIGYLIR